MNVAVSLWHLVQEDRLVRWATYATAGILWFAIAWADRACSWWAWRSSRRCSGGSGASGSAAAGSRNAKSTSTSCSDTREPGSLVGSLLAGGRLKAGVWSRRSESAALAFSSRLVASRRAKPGSAAAFRRYSVRSSALLRFELPSFGGLRREIGVVLEEVANDRTLAAFTSSTRPPAVRAAPP